MKQKKKALESPTKSCRGGEGETESLASESASDEEPPRRFKREKDQQTTPMSLELISWSLKESLTLKNSLIDLVWLSEF